MKHIKTILTTLALLFSLVVVMPTFAQKVDNEVYYGCNLNDLPKFPGGDAALMAFFAENIRYPSGTREFGKVIVQFQVTKEGDVGEVEVIKSVNPELDAEVIRVIKMLPRFNPAKELNGEPKDSSLIVPIIFCPQKDLPESTE